jgi:hypothetical protein
MPELAWLVNYIVTYFFPGRMVCEAVCPFTISPDDSDVRLTVRAHSVHTNTRWLQMSPPALTLVNVAYVRKSRLPHTATGVPAVESPRECC